MQATLRQKILAIFGMLLLVAVFIGVQSIRRFEQLGKAIDVILKENYRSVIACQQMKDALERMDSGVLFILAGFEREGRIQIEMNLPRFERELDIELKNLTLPREPEEALMLKSLFMQYRDKLLVFMGQQMPDRKNGYIATIFPLFLKIKLQADVILQMNQENMHEANNRARIKATKARREIYLFLLVSSFFSILSLPFSNRWILKPIRRLIDSTMEIRNGNLNLNIKVDTQDEIGQLSEAFNAMVTSLRLFRRSEQAKMVRLQRATQEAFKYIPAGIVILDEAGMIEIANDSARTNFGLMPGTSIDQSPYPWLAKLFREALNEESIPSKKRVHERIQHFVNNQEKFFQPKVFPMFNDEEELSGVVIILEDVTLLMQNDDIKRDLFSTVSHQLKTPLTSMRMALHLLLDEKIGILNERQADLLVSARDESERLYGIIEDLLDISRIEAGRTKMNIVLVSPSELVGRAVGSIQREAQDKGVIVEVDVPTDISDVLADPTRINHVISNLLSNAVKYSPPGGRVRVTARPKEDRVIFSISDNGPGIPEKYHAQVFDKFFRIPGAGAGQGEGLGLAIAKEIVKAHGGEITFSSAENEGSTFEFTLNCHEMEAK